MITKEQMAVRLLFTKIHEKVFEVDNSIFHTELNIFLNDLRDEDYFGTEGQCDPRQDWRNN